MFLNLEEGLTGARFIYGTGIKVNKTHILITFVNVLFRKYEHNGNTLDLLCDYFEKQTFFRLKEACVFDCTKKYPNFLTIGFIDIT